MANKEMVIVDLEKIKWEPIEQVLGRVGARESEFMKGAWIKVLRIDKETGARVMLLKYPKGFRAPKHTHPSDESGMVLEGKTVNEKGTEIKKGMYFFIPAGVEHGPMDVPDGCVLLIHSSGRGW
jgi:quercetin dioxygenase-like cupin family protein